MTNTETTTDIISAADLTGAPFGPDDPRHTFAAAVSLARNLIATVHADELDRATPCDDFAVRALVHHVVEVVDRVAALGRGDDPFAPGAPVDDANYLDRLAGAAHEVQRVWSNDAVLAKEVSLPWATFSGGDALNSYTAELTSHTWDLAKALGRNVRFDDRVLTVALDAYRSLLPPTGRAAIFDEVIRTMPPDARGTHPFKEAVPVSADAPLIDQVIAYVGRDPNWQTVR
ncbi:MAG: TIGR03086 family metal-binding protein [Acidimicrobiia bacterium]